MYFTSLLEYNFVLLFQYRLPTKPTKRYGPILVLGIKRVPRKVGVESKNSQISQRTSCNHHNDAGADDEPTRSPPQPEPKALFSKHHLNVFDKAVPS